MKLFASAAAPSFLLAALVAQLPLATVHAGQDDVEFDLGNERPEGTHALSAANVAAMGLNDTGSSYILVSEYFYGGVKLVDVANTNSIVTHIVPSAGFHERGSLGLYAVDKYILTAGGGPAMENPFEVYVYDATAASTDGDKLVATCVPDVSSEEDIGFFNDIAVVGDTAYVTDTTHNRLWNFTISEATAGNCALMYQELDETVFMGDDEFGFRSNGIVPFGAHGGFLISLYQTGGLYYVEPSNNVTEPVIALGDLELADGLELVEEDDGSQTLYITEAPSMVSVYKMEASGDGPGTAPTATKIGVLESDLYNNLATSAVLGDMVYTANVRDAVSENENNTNQLIGVDRFVQAAAGGGGNHSDGGGDDGHDGDDHDHDATPAPTSAAGTINAVMMAITSLTSASCIVMTNMLLV